MSQTITPLGYIALPGAAPSTMTGDGNVAGAIDLKTDLGTSETITITNNKGTANGAIELKSTAGGIKLNPATSKGLWAPLVTSSGASPRQANGPFCKVTFTGLNIAAGASSIVEIWNNISFASSLVNVTTHYMGTGIPVIKTQLSSGSMQITINNVHATDAVNSDITFHVLVINHDA